MWDTAVLQVRAQFRWRSIRQEVVEDRVLDAEARTEAFRGVRFWWLLLFALWVFIIVSRCFLITKECHAEGDDLVTAADEQGFDFADRETGSAHVAPCEVRADAGVVLNDC